MSEASTLRVVTHGAEDVSGAPILPRKLHALCSVCQRVEFRYTCPKCEAVYCSLDCYSRHNDTCTESFYKEQVAGELQSQRAEGPERRRLEEMVQKLNRLDCSDSEDEEDEDDQGMRLAHLAEIAEQGELGPEALTDEELRRFHSEIKRGALSQSLDVWEPWWHKAVHEEAPETVPHLCCTASREVAHAAVTLTVLESLYAYCHTMRTFNGDVLWDPVQATGHVLRLGASICSQKIFKSPPECIGAFLEAAATLPGRVADQTFDALCLLDTRILLGGGASYIVRALRETTALLHKCIELQEGNAKKAVGRLQRGAKKLEFLSSFAFHHSEKFDRLGLEIEAIAAELPSTKNSGGYAQSAGSKNRGAENIVIPRR